MHPFIGDLMGLVRVRNLILEPFILAGDLFGGAWDLSIFCFSPLPGDLLGGVGDLLGGVGDLLGGMGDLLGGVRDLLGGVGIFLEL